MNVRPILSLLFLFLFSCSISISAMAETPTNNGETTLSETQLKAKITTLTERLEVLKEAKKRAVNKQEKRGIRHEIRDVKKEAKALKQQVSGGIYIGSGVLIVALLLILLL